MSEEELKFVDDKLFVYTPIPQYGDGICKIQLVMTKEIFQECYKKWIEPRESVDENLPSVQRTGYWIDKTRSGQKNSECSECHTLFRVLIRDYPYCPVCGSKNRGEL